MASITASLPPPLLVHGRKAFPGNFKNSPFSLGRGKPCFGYLLFFQISVSIYIYYIKLVCFCNSSIESSTQIDVFAYLNSEVYPGSIVCNCMLTRDFELGGLG